MRLAWLLLVLAACREDLPRAIVIAAEVPSVQELPAFAPRPPPPPVVTPDAAVVAPSAPAPAIAISTLLYPVPEIPPTRDRIANDHVGEAADRITRPGRPDPGSYDSLDAAFAAVIRDPSSVAARFVQACALAQHELHDEALVVLQKLQTTGSPACLDVLANGTNPICGFDARANAVLASAKPLAIRIASEAVITAINSGDPAPIERYLGGPISFAGACSVCEADQTDTSSMSPGQFRTFVKGADARIEQGPVMYHRPVLLFCDDRCCAGPTGMLSHTSNFIDSICFRGSKTAPTLASIGYVGGG